MKVAFGYHLQKGAWGGGNQFARSLTDFLTTNGHEVCYGLQDDDIDLILLTEVRGRSPSAAFNAGSVLRYLQFCNPKSLVIHRINECDERKGTEHMNRLLTRANYVSDHTVFIASWLRELKLWRKESQSSVILNGADQALFKPNEKLKWSDGKPLRLVTHHWGGNRQKGADIYEKIDSFLTKPVWKNKIEFTYVGNVPDGCNLPNTHVLPPLSGSELAGELASHHVYVTGSINEPAGMHHIEGALCGLPLIYRNSGALPEYCSGYGVKFEGVDDFEGALKKMCMGYDKWLRRIDNYPHTSDRMCEKYMELFNSLLERREEILSERELWRNPWTFLRNQLAI